MSASSGSSSRESAHTTCCICCPPPLPVQRYATASEPMRYWVSPSDSARSTTLRTPYRRLWTAPAATGPAQGTVQASLAHLKPVEKEKVTTEVARDFAVRLDPSSGLVLGYVRTSVIPAASNA